MPDISVIVPHYNTKSLLRACLDSLGAQTIAPDRYEIIVADNESPGGVGDVARDFPDVRFINVPERGAAHARNAALNIAQGRIVAFIDADCTADPEWLALGVAALESTDLVGGEVKVTVKDPANPTPTECFELVFGFRQKLYVNQKQFSVTANLFASADTARAIGPFIHGISEDVEWCERAAALGFRLDFARKAIVSHPARREWSDLVSKWDRIVRERWVEAGATDQSAPSMVEKVKWVATAVVTVLSILPHSATVLGSDAVPTMPAKMAALGVLARMRVWRANRMMAFLFAAGDPAAKGRAPKVKPVGV